MALYSVTVYFTVDAEDKEEAGRIVNGFLPSDIEESSKVMDFTVDATGAEEVTDGDA